MNIFSELGAEWIWLPQNDEVVNQYVNFRHEFCLEDAGAPGEAGGTLYISADTEYVVWINGAFADFGQYDDYPDHKAYDVLEVGKYLRPGKNVLCILGYYQGENSYQYIKGRPGLAYALKAGREAIASSSAVYCRQSAEYKSGEIEKVSPQLLFTFEYNAIRDDGWRSHDYQRDSSWVKAEIKRELMKKIVVYERPIQKLSMENRAEGKITAQGVFVREGGKKVLYDKQPTPAELMQRDYLSSRLPTEVFQKDCGYTRKLPSEGIRIDMIPEGNDGVYLLIDLQQEEAGLFELELEGSEGTDIDAAYGEHVDDLRVRASMGGRNFAFRYVCRNGHQTFTHYIKRIAGRFLELHISGAASGVTLYYAGIRPVRYPVLKRGQFSCNDRLFSKIYDVSVRTLELCMHEHYEDTPWREQAFYAMDSRNQALCGYYCFGEYAFAEASWSLMAESLTEDGYLEICAPARDRITIPSFSMGWILAVADFVLYSGRLEAARQLFPTVKKMLDNYVGAMENGLMAAPSGERYWNFYEWADGLDGGWTFDAPFKNGDSRRLDAPLNLFLCLALEAGAKLARWTGNNAEEIRYGDCLIKLRRAVHTAFWNEGEGAYQTYAGEECREHYTELVQALAIYSGTASGELAGELRKRLSGKDNALVRTTLSYSLFKYEALLQEPDRYSAVVFEEIGEDWGYMLYNKATSFWETIEGADAFEKAGSMCHGWSAIPVYFFQAYLLGVKPIEPGFQVFTVAPVHQALDKAFGKVPTPCGDIHVVWERNGPELDCKVSFPDGLHKV